MLGVIHLAEYGGKCLFLLGAALPSQVWQLSCTTTVEIIKGIIMLWPQAIFKVVYCTQASTSHGLSNP